MSPHFHKSADGQYLNNRVSLSRNLRLIVAPVLKTNICPRSETSTRAKMLVLIKTNFQGTTIRPRSETYTLYCLYSSPLNLLPRAITKIITLFSTFLNESSVCSLFFCVGAMHSSTAKYVHWYFMLGLKRHDATWKGNVIQKMSFSPQGLAILLPSNRSCEMFGDDTTKTWGLKST